MARESAVGAIEAMHAKLHLARHAYIFDRRMQKARIANLLAEIETLHRYAAGQLLMVEDDESAVETPVVEASGPEEEAAQ